MELGHAGLGQLFAVLLVLNVVGSFVVWPPPLRAH